MISILYTSTPQEFENIDFFLRRDLPERVGHDFSRYYPRLDDICGRDVHSFDEWGRYAGIRRIGFICERIDYQTLVRDLTNPLSEDLD